MPFTIPNLADAFNGAQTEPDKVDIDILTAGLGGDGVLSGCAVTAQGSPNMTLAVAAGSVRIAGVVASVAAGNVTITTANATNPRFDLVVVNSSGTKSVTAGTAASSPVFPAIPASSVVLAAVFVPANDTAIQTNQITDKRVLLPGTALTQDATFYLSGGGSDANDGLTLSTPKRSLSAAYAALPSTGGTIYLAPGRYDVGAGFSISRGKPVALIGTVKPAKFIVSTSTTPLNINAAVLYTSTGAASLVTTIGGTAGLRLDGCRFSNLVFELSATTTETAIEANSCNFGEVDHCVFFADKTTGPASVTAEGLKVYCVAPGTYGGDDASWWRVRENVFVCMALGTFGNRTGTLRNCNQHVIQNNIGLGLTHTNTSALPFVSIFGGNRCLVQNNNIEAYYRGVYMSSCWSCAEDSDGGEFVDIFVDLEGCKGLRISPLGILYGPLGSYAPYVTDALLVRTDAFVKASVFILPTTWTSANTQRVYPPTDDATDPACSFGSTDNIVITGRQTTFQGVKFPVVTTGSPEGVLTGNVGDMVIRTDGGSASTLYIKETGTGNTGWVGHGAALPSQTSQSGKFLTTDGTTASWGVPPGGTVVRNGASDQAAINSGNTGSTLTNFTGLTFNTTASGTDVYFVEAIVRINTANVTMDVKFGWSVPAGATMQWGAMDTANSALAAFGPQATSASPAALLTESGTLALGGVAGGGTFFIHLGALVFGGGTAGAVQLRLAQNTSDAGNLIAKANSFLKITQVAT